MAKIKSIYKYKISKEPTVNKIQVVKGAELLTADFDCYGNLCVWFVVDTKEKEKEDIFIQTLYTGGLIGNVVDLKYINTVVDTENKLVLHIFSWRTNEL